MKSIFKSLKDSVIKAYEEKEHNNDTLELAKAMLAPMIPREIHCPEGAKCNSCGSNDIVRITAPAWGPYGGQVICKSCGYKESVMSYLGKSCISVEPLCEDVK